VAQPRVNQPLDDLQRWYVAQCNGDWEHTYGVTIESLDNPGWRLTVDLVGTDLEALPDTSDRVERSEADWLVWRVADGRFEAACGACNLGEAVAAFFALHR
jgi:hypothetical protein